MPQLSRRVVELRESVTLSLAANAADLEKRGVDVVRLDVGQPDFQPMVFAREAGAKAMASGSAGYTPSRGKADVREIYAGFLEYVYGVHYNPGTEIQLAAGGKQGLDLIFGGVLDPGGKQEILTTRDCWLSYKPVVERHGGELIGARSVRDFPAAITPQTKAILIPAPNPTGVAATREELELIGRLAERSDIWVIEDAIYEGFNYDRLGHPGTARDTALATTRCPGLHSRTIISTCESKKGAMPGWRGGAVLGPAAAMKGLAADSSHAFGNLSTPVQDALAATWRDPEAYSQWFEEHRLEYQRRRDVTVAMANEIPGVRLWHGKEPDSAFYAYLEVNPDLGVGAIDVAQGLLHAEKPTVVVPGDDFGVSDTPDREGSVGAPMCFRVAYTSTRFEEGMERITQHFKRLTGDCSFGRNQVVLPEVDTLPAVETSSIPSSERAPERLPGD